MSSWESGLKGRKTRFEVKGIGGKLIYKYPAPDLRIAWAKLALATSTHTSEHGVTAIFTPFS